MSTNFATFMCCHEHCNGRCPRDVSNHIPFIGMAHDDPFVGCRHVVAYP